MMRGSLSFSPEQATDVLALGLFIPMLMISVPALASLSWPLAAAIVLGGIASYIVTSVFLPLSKSAPLEDPVLNQTISDNYVHFRVGSGIGTRAIDLGFRKYIIFNKQDWDGHYGDWKALIGHEYSHIKNGDARYFHFAGIGGIILLLNLMLFIWFFFLLALGIDVETESDVTIFDFLLPLMLAALSVFLLMWIKQSLHSREFRADREGCELNPAAFGDWLRRARRDEQLNGDDRLLSQISHYKWFTHPSFKRRVEAVQNPKNDINFNLVAEALRSSGFIYLSGMLAYAIAQLIISQTENDVPSNIFMVALYFLMVLFPLGVAGGAISIPAMKALDRGGYRICAKYVVLMALINWFLLLSYYSLTVFWGYYEPLTVESPSVPQQSLTSGVVETLFLFLNFGLSMFLLCLLGSKLSGRHRYNPILHVFIGWSSVGMALLLMKVQYGGFA